MTQARRFWDERADEDAFYFVDNRLEYGAPEDERFWARGDEDVRVLLDAAGLDGLPPGSDVVEIGCGVGRLTRVLARDAASVRAIDVSPRMIELARSYNPALPGVTWLVGDGVSLDGVDSASADVCVSHVVFQHIPDPAVTLAYVREMGRVLRAGGLALFQVSNDPGVHAAPRSVRDRVRSLLARGPRGQDDPHWRGSAIELDALRAAAADGGMALERVSGAGTQWCVVLARKG